MKSNAGIFGLLRSPATWVAAGVLATAAMGFGAAVSRYRLMLNKEAIYPPANRQLIALPRELSEWIALGQDRRESPEIEAELGTSNYVSRLYKRKDTPAGENPVIVDFHAAYYTGMIDTVPHVSDRCFVGAGMSLVSAGSDVTIPIDPTRWRLVEDEDVPVELAGRLFRARLPNSSDQPGGKVYATFNPNELKLRTFRFRDGNGRDIYSGYFFIANGGVVARAEGVRLLAFDLRSKYAYYCKVQFTSTSVNSEQELGEKAGSLLNELLPEIMRCVPPWQDVKRGTFPEPVKPTGA
jgi:hypothetical protein